MTNSKYSLWLCQICTLLFIVGVVLILFVAPWITNWFTKYTINAAQKDYVLFLLTLYSGGLVALSMLVSLFRALRNISKGQIFVKQNVSLLRWISIFCLVGGVIGVLSALYYPAWGVVGIGALFVGLIVWVIKNVIAQAVALKEENDYTI